MSGRRLRIAQIVASVEAEAAGPSYSVPSLARALRDAGGEVELLSLGEPGVSQTMGVTHRRFARTLAGAGPLGKLGVSPQMRAALSAAAASTDVFHTNGLWMMPNVYPSQIARAGRPAVVLSPRGMLSPAALQYSAGVKKLFWAMAQGRAARKVAMFHATSDQEFEDIRAYGLKQPVAVIPNGIDVPALEQKRGTAGDRMVLFLGRLHPIKRVDALIQAWATLEAEFSGWRLEIRGPGDPAYVEQLKARAAALGLARCSFGDGLFGDAKNRAFREASLYVLPSESENFAMTIAESLAAGTPAIATKGTPWSGLSQKGCGWWIDHGSAPLAAALREAMARPADELEAMGKAGREWMLGDFSWQAIGRDMQRAYQWIIGGGDRPSFVHM